MNNRDRVIQAIAHKTSDIIPWQLDLTQGLQERLCDNYGDCEFLYTRIGNHLIREKNKNHKPIDDLAYKDIFGVTWCREQVGGDIGVVRDYILKDPDIGGYDFPKPDAELIGRKCLNMTGNHGEHVPARSLRYCEV